MSSMNITDGKYVAFPPIDLPNREWPSKVITAAPRWCSVDLRDGNQAIHTPMTKEKKKVFFEKLVEIGFNEIEVGFPSASQTDYDFVRLIIEENLIPSGTAIQVLVQAREHLIKKTFEALEGAPKIIVHLYNSTSPAQRRDVFGKSKEEIIDIALSGVDLIKEYKKSFKGEVILQYSPESFSLTELDFAKEISDAVIARWDTSVNGKVILNLPATVECATPNVHADQIEWMCKNLNNRENVIISLHNHNDRGTAVASAELGILAGADRVEGTLFGNGERTGNADIITIALNMTTQGIESKLNFRDIDSIREIYEDCTEMDVHDRHPYVGDLVYSAFSGSHQDAISKGLKLRKSENRVRWDVPYLPMDPNDVGRDYEAIVKINSQSGKGGAAFVLEHSAGYTLPKPLQVEFSRFVQEETDLLKRELEKNEIVSIFEKEFLNRKDRIVLESFLVERQMGENSTTENVSIEVTLKIDGISKLCKSVGDGAINGLTNILNTEGFSFTLKSYDEHAMSSGSDAVAVSYISIEDSNGVLIFGAGTDSDISLCSAKALISAINRAF